MFITGIGTAVPVTRYTQAECWEALRQSRQFPTLAPRSRAILRKVLVGSNGIQTRHLALERLEEAFALSADVLHDRFARHAPELAASAAQRAMEQAGVAASQVDALLVSTCTGYLCPGLTSYVGERLGLNRTTLGLDLVGQGCGAALPNLMTADALISAGRSRTVLAICVEVCSAAFYLDDDPGVLISACLFGDGAAAAILQSEPGGKRKRPVQWRKSGSIIEPTNRDLLRFEQKQGMLRNVLAQQVPKVAAAQAAALFTRVSTDAVIERDAVCGWIVHPGGRDVLAEVGARLGLTPDQLRASAGVLSRYGNLSSPSVLFVLDEALNDSVPDGTWWMTAFGAGFSCYGAFLQVGG